MKYWINTISRDHVQRGIQGGFTQANHGKNTVLKRLAKDDRVVFYSPKTVYQDGVPLQAFTAVAKVADEEPYQFEMSPDFMPWRRRLEFIACQETPIKPLIDELSFITDSQHWGYKFRLGLFEISKADFRVISSAMQADLLQ